MVRALRCGIENEKVMTLYYWSCLNSMLIVDNYAYIWLILSVFVKSNDST